MRKSRQPWEGTWPVKYERFYFLTTLSFVWTVALLQGWVRHFRTLSNSCEAGIFSCRETSVIPCRESEQLPCIIIWQWLWFGGVPWSSAVHSCGRWQIHITLWPLCCFPEVVASRTSNGFFVFPFLFRLDCKGHFDSVDLSSDLWVWFSCLLEHKTHLEAPPQCHI